MIQPLLLFALLLQAPGYTISGTVVHGLTGKPLNRTYVAVAPIEQRTVTTIVVTGPDGRFRFNGLKAGKYSLMAERSGFERQAYMERHLHQGYATAVVVGEHQSGENLVFRMTPGAVITGHVIDTRGEPVPGLTVRAFRLAGAGTQRRIQYGSSGTTDDRGYYRIHSLPAGMFALTVAGRPWRSQSALGLEPTAYPVTFYPGTTRAENAGSVRLEPGRDTRADFVVNPVPAVTVSGRLSGGERRGVQISLTVPGIGGSEVTYGEAASVYGNKFTLKDVALGRYFVNAWEEHKVIARGMIDVTAPDTTIDLSETPLPELSATVELRGTPPAAGRQIILGLRHISGLSAGARALDKEGHAVIPNLQPGRYEVHLGEPLPMAIVEMTARGAAIAGGLLDVPETGAIELKIVADASAPDVRGIVLRGEQPVPGMLAMLVPRIGWQNYASYRFDQSDSDGTFTWHGVPPGDYLMFALEKGEPMDYGDPDVIRSLLGTAEPVTITGAPNQTVRLTPAARP